MSQGPIDHPSYITRQQIPLGKTTAGANGVTNLKAFPASNIRLRNILAMVTTAGTSSGAGAAAALIVVGTSTSYPTVGSTSTVTTTSTTTNTLGTATLGSSTAGTVVLFGDVNTTVNQGAVIKAVNGTDASSVVDLVAEAYIDPLSNWTGN